MYGRLGVTRSILTQDVACVLQAFGSVTEEIEYEAETTISWPTMSLQAEALAGGRLIASWSPEVLLVKISVSLILD
jgi:hypothetical protein